MPPYSVCESSTNLLSLAKPLSCSSASLASFVALSSSTATIPTAVTISSPTTTTTAETTIMSGVPSATLSPTPVVTRPASHSFSLQRPQPSQDSKKTRNAKRLSLFVPPSPGKLESLAMAPSPSFPPASASFLRPGFGSALTSTSNSENNTTDRSTSRGSESTSQRHSQLWLDQSLPTPKWPISTTTSASMAVLTATAEPTTTPAPAPAPTLATTTPAASFGPGTMSSALGRRRPISAYFADFSAECGTASPYTKEPVRVLPYLYLGAEHNAMDTITLSRLGITAVLNVAVEIASDMEKPAISPDSSTSGSNQFRNSFPAGESISWQTQKQQQQQQQRSKGSIWYKSLAWSHHQRNLQSEFPTAFEFIEHARSQGGKVLVHCQLGVSRSASLVIAYVMKSEGMTLNSAYDFVKQRSAVISPNMSLMYQLAEFEKTLQSNNLGDNKHSNKSDGNNSASSNRPRRRVSASPTWSQGLKSSGVGVQEDEEDYYPYPTESEMDKDIHMDIDTEHHVRALVASKAEPSVGRPVTRPRSTYNRLLEPSIPLTPLKDRFSAPIPSVSAQPISQPTSQPLSTTLGVRARRSSSRSKPLFKDFVSEGNEHSNRYSIYDHNGSDQEDFHAGAGRPSYLAYPSLSTIASASPTGFEHTIPSPPPAPVLTMPILSSPAHGTTTTMMATTPSLAYFDLSPPMPPFAFESSNGYGPCSSPSSPSSASSFTTSSMRSRPSSTSSIASTSDFPFLESTAKSTITPTALPSSLVSTSAATAQAKAVPPAIVSSGSLEVNQTRYSNGCDGVQTRTKGAHRLASALTQTWSISSVSQQPPSPSSQPEPQPQPQPQPHSQSDPYSQPQPHPIPKTDATGVAVSVLEGVPVMTGVEMEATRAQEGEDPSMGGEVTETAAVEANTCEFIFSPRPHSPPIMQTIMIGDYYQALRMGG